MKVRTLEIFVHDYHDPLKMDRWEGYIDITVGWVPRRRYKGWVWFSRQRSGWYSRKDGLRLPDTIQWELYARMREEEFKEAAAAQGQYIAQGA